MADLNDVIQGLVDVDKTIIEKVQRGSGTYAILDVNTENFTGEKQQGTGSLTADNLASHNKSYQLFTSASANYILYKNTFSDVKYGHYAICLRVKTSAKLSANLLQLKIFNGNSVISTTDFTGNHFDTTSDYSYLYAEFDYNSNGNTTKQPLSMELHTHLANSIKINFDYAYISMIIPSVYL